MLWNQHLQKDLATVDSKPFTGTAKPFRCNIYAKHGGRGPGLVSPAPSSLQSPTQGSTNHFLTYPVYFQNITHSFVQRRVPNPLQSIGSALFPVQREGVASLTPFGCLLTYPAYPLGFTSP